MGGNYSARLRIVASNPKTRPGPATTASAVLVCALPIVLDLAFFPGLDLPFTAIKTGILLASTGVLFFLSSLSQVAMDRGSSRFAASMNVALLAFSGIVVLSAAFTPLRYMTVEKAAWYLTGPLLFYAASVALRGNQRRFFTCVALGALAVALVAAVQFALGRDFLFPMFGRSSMVSGRMLLFSTSGNPNFVAALLAASAPSFLLLATGARNVRRWVWLICLVGILAVVIATGSRAGVLAFFLAIAVTVGVHWPTRRNLTALTSVVLAVVVVLLYLGIRNPRPFADAATGRSVIWRATLSQNEWMRPLGSGPGTFDYLYPTRVGHFVITDSHADLVRFAENETSALNDYVETWSELGAIGLALLLAILFVWFRGTRRVLRDDSSSRTVVATAIGTVVAILVLALVDSPLQRADTWVLFWLALAVPLATATETRSGERRMLNIILSVLVVVAAFWFGIRPVAASYFIQQGQDAESENHNATALQWYDRAIRWDSSQGTAYFNRTRVLAKLDSLPAAWAASADLLRWVNEPECWILRARIARAMGNSELAVQQLRIARQTFPYSAAVLDELSAYPDAR